MAIANVALTDTFDEWRVKTNQVIVQSDQFFTSITTLGTTSNTVFAKANVAANSANAGYAQANLAYTRANTAYTQGNTAFTQANVAYTQGNTSYTQANIAFTTANNGWTQANTARTHANAAFLKANNVDSAITGFSTDISTAQSTADVAAASAAAGFTQANTARTTANSGFAQANTAYTQANNGWTQANTARTHANSGFTTANNAWIQANAAFTRANSSAYIDINVDVGNANRFILFTEKTTGNTSYMNIQSTKLTFNPTSGTLNATNFNSLSDREQKDNIQKIQDALNKVGQLNGVHFTWKDNGLPSAGIIAQDLIKVMPELVADNMSVNYSGIIGLLVEAVKELTERVKALEEK